MTSNLGVTSLSQPATSRQAQLTGGLLFDWIMSVVSVWWMAGLFIDGWAHSNLPQLETFFTPWHAVFYSGYLAVGLALLAKLLQNLRQLALQADGTAPSWSSLVRDNVRGNRWRRAIPAGYELSMLGLVIFGISGIGDLTWHIILGIERNTEALLSPTHLGLALGIGLAVSGPLRAAWRRPGRVMSWRQLGPAIVSLTFTFSLLTFFTEYASALLIPMPLIDSQNSASNGITYILFNTALMMGFVLLAVRRWRLPFGSFAFMLGLNGAIMIVFFPPSWFVAFPVGLLGGFAVDLAYRLVQPTQNQPERVHLFAFLAPTLFYIVYFLDLAIGGPMSHFHNGILWAPPFWAGAPIIAGIAGLLLSFVMFPPILASEGQE